MLPAKQIRDRFAVRAPSSFEGREEYRWNYTGKVSRIIPYLLSGLSCDCVRRSFLTKTEASERSADFMSFMVNILRLDFFSSAGCVSHVGPVMSDDMMTWWVERRLCEAGGHSFLHSSGVVFMKWVKYKYTHEERIIHNGDGDRGREDGHIGDGLQKTLFYRV